jgi:hypothetical protein
MAAGYHEVALPQIPDRSATERIRTSTEWAGTFCVFVASDFGTQKHKRHKS